MKYACLAQWIFATALIFSGSARAAIYQIDTASLRFDRATFSVGLPGEEYPVFYSLNGFLEIELGSVTSFSSGTTYQTIEIDAEGAVTDTPAVRPFVFPLLTGFIDESSFSASFCGYSIAIFGGSCFNGPNYDYYSGTLNGGTLQVSGNAALNEFHSYYFEITATQVPAPASSILFLSSLLVARGLKIHNKVRQYRPFGAGRPLRGRHC